MKHSLDEPWTLDGDWFVSTDPSATPVPGDLEYDPERGLQLKLRGILSDKCELGNRTPSYARVFGSAPRVGPCTLLDTFANQRSFGAVTRSSLVVNQAILGAELPKARHVRFNESASALGNLEEWIGWSPIRQEGASFSYEVPNALEAAVPLLDARLAVVSTADSKSEGWHRVELVHTARLIVTANRRKQRDLPWHLDVQRAFRDLLTLFSGDASWFRTIDLKKRKQARSASFAGVRVRRPNNKLHAPWMALPWDLVPLSFEDLVLRWFDHRKTRESAHHLLFGSFYERMPYTEFAFLAAAQALESYVKAPLSRSASESKNFLSCVKDVINSFTPAIRRRLFSASRKFPERIRDTRNYFTHYSKHLASRAYRGHDLYRATLRLRLILTLAFMRDLGIPEQTLLKRVLTRPEPEFQLKWRG